MSKTVINIQSLVGTVKAKKKDVSKVQEIVLNALSSSTGSVIGSKLEDVTVNIENIVNEIQLID